MKKKRSYIVIDWSFVLLLASSFLFGFGGLICLYFVCLVLHELCHSICAKRLGYKIGRIKLLATGAALEAESDEFAYADEIKIALAGPLFNLVFALGLVVFWWIIPETYNFTQDLFVINMAIFCFNLLPSFPLDGGRVLLAWLSQRVERRSAVRICRAVTLCLSLLMFMLFIFSLFTSVNFTLGAVSVTLFISGITEEKAAVYKRSMMRTRKIERTNKRGVEVRYLLVNQKMEDFRLYRLLSARFYTIFVLVDDNFNRVGIVEEDKLIERLKAPK